MCFCEYTQIQPSAGQREDSKEGLDRRVLQSPQTATMAQVKHSYLSCFGMAASLFIGGADSSHGGSNKRSCLVLFYEEQQQMHTSFSKANYSNIN